MMKSIAIVSLLICTLFAFASADEQATGSGIVLDVYKGSNTHWLKFAVQNEEDVATISVEMKGTGSSSWEAMDLDAWGYWTYTSKVEIEYPVSIRITTESDEQVIIDDAISFGASSAHNLRREKSNNNCNPTAAPTTKPTKAPTAAPTTRPATSKPTKAPTAAPTTRPTTTTKATTKPTTTTKATTKPTTQVTAKPSTSGGSTGGCSGAIGLMVPLYVYPGSQWDTVAAGGRLVPTIAIINPNNGPGGKPDSSYTSYMTKLKNAGVEMVGYVHTSYGARAIKDVKADIATYASEFPLLVGIFIDETATGSAQLSYYQELYSYIMSMPGWKYDILNPGTVPSSGYLAASTQIVAYEDTASKFSSSSNPSGASCSNKDQFAVISYAASSASAMQSLINTAVSKGYYGWVYATDGTLSGNTYGSIPSYYSAMATYLASVN